MRSVSKTMLACFAIGVVACLATPMFAQQSKEIFVPPIVAPNSQYQPLPPDRRVLPPILSAERARASSSSGMLQPVSPTPEMMIDQQVQPLDTSFDAAGKTVSSAGIPIYPQGSAILQHGGLNATSAMKNAAFNQDPNQVGGSRFAPPIVDSTDLTFDNDQYATPNYVAPTHPMPQVETPESVMRPAVSTPRTVYPQPAAAPRQSSPIVPPSSTIQSPINQAPGANNYFAQPANFPAAPAGQSNTAAAYGAVPVDTGCTSCGPGGCYDPNAVESQFGCSGSVPNASYYLMAEAMAFNRYDGDIQASNFFELSDFGWGAGGRFTLGYRQNATIGRELTIFGTFQDLEETKEFNDSQNRLNALFIPDGGFGFFEVGSFFNANRQVQTKSSEMFSIEYSRVKWGYDIIKTQLGLRYIYMDDSFTFFSDNGTTGTFNMHSINNLLGADWGYELFYDVGYRLSVSAWNKYGGYLNLADFDTLLANNGLVSINKNIKDSHMASTIELGFMGHYQLNPRVRFRLGYEVMWMWGIFTVNNNFPRTFDNPFLIPRPDLVNPNTGSDLNTNNEPVSWNGISFGLEIFR